MRFGTCAREKDVAELLANGHWPDACPEELRAHADGCRACRDLALVTQAMRGERAQAVGHARLEPAGALWWRAQLRRRNAVLQRIDRPVFGAHIFAIAVSLVGAMVFLVAELRRGVNWLSWLQALPRSLHLEVLVPGAPPDFTGTASLPVLLLAMLAVMSGVIVYVVSDKQ